MKRIDVISNKWYWNQFAKITLADYINIKYHLYVRECELSGKEYLFLEDWLEEEESCEEKLSAVI